MPNGGRARRRRSEIYVPRLHYGRDYKLVVHGAEVTRGFGRQRIELRACRGVKTVTVAVTDKPPRHRPRCRSS